MDTIDLASVDRNAKYKYLQVFFDHFNKFIWVQPSNKNTADEIIKALTQITDSEINKMKILSDNATNFKAKSLNKFMYHPQTNGNVERFNDTILTKIRIHLHKRPNVCWATVERNAVRDYDTPHSATKFEPRYFLTGDYKRPDFAEAERNIVEDQVWAHIRNKKS